MTEAEFTEYSMVIGSTLLIGYMMFIIWQLSRESKAGKFGTFILFVVLSVGMLGFIAKNVIAWLLDI